MFDLCGLVHASTDSLLPMSSRAGITGKGNKDYKWKIKLKSVEEFLPAVPTKVFIVLGLLNAFTRNQNLEHQKAL